MASLWVRRKMTTGSGTTGTPIPPPPKPLDAINKHGTVWAAIAAGAVTILAIPQVQTGLIYLIQHPSAQGAGAAAGTILTGILLYFSHPYGTTNTPAQGGP